MAIQQYPNRALSLYRGCPKRRDAGRQRPLAIFVRLSSNNQPLLSTTLSTQLSRNSPHSIAMEGPLPYSSTNGPYFQPDKFIPSVIIMIQLNIILQFIFTKVFRINFVCSLMSCVLHILPTSPSPQYRHKRVPARQMTSNCSLLSMWNFLGEKQIKCKARPVAGCPRKQCMF